MSILDYIEKIKQENEGPRITGQEPRIGLAGGGFLWKLLYKGKSGLQEGSIARKLKEEYIKKGMDKWEALRKSGIDASDIVKQKKSTINATSIIKAQKAINDIYVDEKVEDYVLNLVFATRNPTKHGLEDLSQLIQYGASPRATINLILASKASAFLEGRGYITPEDVRYIGIDVLRHRIILTYEAEAEELTSEDIIQRLFDFIEIP